MSCGLDFDLPVATDNPLPAVPLERLRFTAAAPAASARSPSRGSPANSGNWIAPLPTGTSRMVVVPPLVICLVTPSARAGALVALNAVMTPSTSTGTNAQAHTLVCFILTPSTAGELAETAGTEYLAYRGPTVMSCQG